MAIVSGTHQSGGNLYAEKLAAELGATVIPVSTGLLRMRSMVKKDRVEVVDIQLEYRTFGSHLKTLFYLPLLVLLLRGNTSVFITIHGILTKRSLRGQSMESLKLAAYDTSLRLSARLATGLVVHSREMLDAMPSAAAPKTTVIPHGTGPLRYLPQGPGRSNLLFFGFIRPSKGLEVLLEAFTRVVATHPDIVLTIAGGPNRESEAPYQRRISELAQDPQLKGRVLLRTGFVGNEEIISLAQSSGILALPYTDEFVEVSGVLHDFAGYGMAVVCSDTPRFSELDDDVDCLKSQPTAQGIASCLSRLLDDGNLREKLARNLFIKAESESWRKVADARISLYSGAAARLT